jgi:Acetyltransferase (GNAT) domain
MPSETAATRCAVLSDAATRCAVLSDAAAIAQSRDALAHIAEQPDAASGVVQHPDWMLCELALRGAAARAHIVVVRDDAERIVGYAPFLAEEYVARIPLGTRAVNVYRGLVYRLLGSGVVSAPADRGRVEQAIAGSLAADSRARVVRIQETLLPNAFASTMQRIAGFSTVASNLLDQVNWTIPRQESLEAYLAALGSKRKNDLTRRVRSVYKKLGDDTELRTFETGADVDEYCRLLNRVYAASWHAKELPIDWEHPARRALLRRFADEHHFVGHLLMLGERPVAYVHGYRLGGNYLLDDTGYDEEFASLGVGSALVFQVVQDLLTRHGDVIDFGYGDNQYKRVLASNEAACGSLYLVRGVAARLRFAAIKPLRWAYRRVRQMQQARKQAAAPTPR